MDGASGDSLSDGGVMDTGFIHAFVASMAVNIVSELGDRTFCIAAILAMRHSRLTVFTGAMTAVALMTIISALLGYATTVIPHWFTHYASIALFAAFGVQMFRAGYKMSPDEADEEMEEAQEDISKKEEELKRSGNVGASGVSCCSRIFSPVFLQTFTLIFLGEWGDRSQVATIIIAARDPQCYLIQEVPGVIVGGTLGNGLCTGLAVLGGHLIAQKISLKTVQYVGGVMFLVFALSALILGPAD